MAVGMTGPDARRPDFDPGTWLLGKIDARERVLTGQVEQTQAEIDTLIARLGELSEAIEDLRISRKTLVSLAEEDPAPDEPVAQPPAVPDHPAYQQILAVFGEAGGSLRARDLAVAMDLPLTQNSIQNVRAKLKRLANRGILVETEPGIVHSNAPIARTASLRPADLSQPHRRKGHQLAERTLRPFRGRPLARTTAGGMFRSPPVPPSVPAGRRGSPGTSPRWRRSAR